MDFQQGIAADTVLKTVFRTGSTIIGTDESKLNLVGSDGKIFVWKYPESTKVMEAIFFSRCSLDANLQKPNQNLVFSMRLIQSIPCEIF